MRGALNILGRFVAHAGIIPADAGSTCSCPKPCARCADHPRGCGEHGDDDGDQEENPGSSPRMRGALMHNEITCNGDGIIPADAGSTRRGSGSCRRLWDHPRGCGEHIGLYQRLPCQQESSPRMRGARSGRGGDRPAGGIIPADAGST